MKNYWDLLSMVRFMGTHPCISQVRFEVINEVFLLCNDDLYIDYIYDLCFPLSSWWCLNLLKCMISNEMSLLSCFQCFYAWLSYLVNFVLTTFPPSVGSGSRGDHFSGYNWDLWIFLACSLVLMVRGHVFLML